MMKKFFVVAGVLMTCVVNAQWTSLNTGTDIRLNAIASDDVMGQVAVGLGPSTDSGSYSGMYASGDNGNTWTRVYTTHVKNVELWDADFTPNGHLWTIGDSGCAVLQTIWFQTYDSYSFISPYSLRAGAAVNDSVFYCGGEHGIVYRTLNRGLNWTTLPTPTTETINDIYFANAADGWIVCDDGYMAVTGDSGNTWQFVAQPMWGFVDIKGFDYQDSLGMNPYLVGSNGVANFSVDGGMSWATFASGTGATLQQIRFGTNNAGLIAGDNGYILRTDNAGWTWFADPSSESVDFFDIAYAGDTTAFICGDSGVILRSTIDISSVGTHESTLFSASGFPNPTNGPFNLRMMLPAESDLTIDVMDITGNIIHTEYHENVMAGESNLSFDLSGHAAGIYFVRISNGFSAVNMRVVRQ
jgi:photosystem II stability/assembly factor-like uncharacterized protein